MGKFSSIDAEKDSMVKTLKRWSHINSGSYNLQGLEKMRDELVSEFSSIADEHSVHQCKSTQQLDDKGNTKEEKYGPALLFRKRVDAKFRVLLCGHMDTVFPADHSFQTTKLLDENTLNGPGVADMKGGLLVMHRALTYFEKNYGGDIKDIGWDVLINADEEISSIGSATLLEKYAKQCNVGLVYEPSLPDGTIVGERKGTGNFVLKANGRAAHAGREFEKGRNAIVALSKIVGDIDALNKNNFGITLNIGRISGGGALNVVPDTAITRINVRTVAKSDENWVQARLDALVNNWNACNNVSVELSGGFSRPPKTISPANHRLFELLKECGNALDMDIEFESTGGCCDGNNLAAAGLPNIDTLGVRGGNIHSDQEYVLLDSLTERVKLSATLLEKIVANQDEFQTI